MREMAIAALLGKLAAWLATNWVMILKLIGIGTAVAVAGTTIWRYIESTGRPEVQQTTATVAMLTQSMIPLMINFMILQLMMSFISMFREMVPRREEVR